MLSRQQVFFTNTSLQYMLDIIMYNPYNFCLDLFTDSTATRYYINDKKYDDQCLHGVLFLFYRYHAGTLGWMHGYLKDDSLKIFRATRVMLEGRYSIVGRFV